MKVNARIELHGAAKGPDSWDENWGSGLPLEHVICRGVDGAPHTVSEFIWPWTAYTTHHKQTLLSFYYWKQNTGSVIPSRMDVTAEREARMRELQFLMMRHIYFGEWCSSKTLYEKLRYWRYVARFAEARSCSVRDVLTQTTLLDACGASLPKNAVHHWMGLLAFLRQLDPKTQLGFAVATAKGWKDLDRRAKEYRNSRRQYAPLPTRIYAEHINNLSKELDDIDEHKSNLVAVMREACAAYRQAKAIETGAGIKIGGSLIEKYGLAGYLKERGFSQTRLVSLAGAVSEIFFICKLQIHLFSGMRDAEALHLPYHCMVSEKASHGRKHCLLIGSTTKLNNGRRLRTKWVTTESDGYRAVRLAQEFATVIYESLGVTPSEGEEIKDDYPLFPSPDYLPWMRRRALGESHFAAFSSELSCTRKGQLLSRLCPLIEEDDVAELEEIDPFRAWRTEPEFEVGQRWPLTTHQLRRSLAVYANASGLVRLSSLRRQLQHITREMAMYYGRGSTFCKNFIAENLVEYRKHVAVDWQEGAEEAEMLAFVRDVLNSTEPMFGGAGSFFDRQRIRGEVMSREDVVKQMKAGLLAYHDGPLGGCTRPGECENRKGLALIDTVCATDGCKYLIGKHSKIVQTVRLKRAAMQHITPGSINEAMEREELNALERVEQEWRSAGYVAAASMGGERAQ